VIWRAKNRVSLGMQVVFMGRQITVDPARQQVLDLLLSTFEEAVIQNRQLRQREEELQLAKAELDRYAGTLELRLQTVLETIPDALFSVDASLGNLFYVSPGAGTVFGYAPDEMIADPQLWRRSIHTDDFAAVLEAFGRAIGSGLPQAVECRFQWRQGDWRWLQLKVAAVVDGPQAGVRLDGVARDITDQRRAEESLRASEVRHRALFETSRDALMTLAAPLWRFGSGNPATIAMFGARDEADFIARAPWEFSPARQPDGSDSATKAQEMIATAVREGSHFFEWTHKRLTGEEFSASVLLSRMEAGGQPLVQATVRDETARKRDERRIVHLNRILRAVRDINQLIVRERDRQRLIEDTCRLLVESRGYRGAMVILTDAAGVPRAWAEAGMGEVFQPLAESLRRAVLPECCRLAAPCEGVYHITDREEACRLCPIGTDCVSSDASCIQLRHGETIYGYLGVSVDRALGVDAEEDSLLGEVAGDVAFALHGIERAEAMTQVEADRDRAEAALRQSQKMEAIGRLAGGVAHDFNNILTVITASCSFLEDGLHAPDPLLDDVRTVREAAQSAVKLTRQLLAFGRRQVLEPRPLDLNVLVAESEKMLGRLIGEDVAIRIEPAPVLGFALADPGQLEQVIINLAVNSRDAMPDGGTLTIATANVELDEAFVSLHAGSSAGPFVRLAVSDTGVGMDAETVVRVFEPFFTTKAVGKGTGLGLSTVYGIVKQSGGFIAVDSAPGRGATFAIYLPRVEPAGQPWRPPTEARASQGRGETILLVEDNDLLRTAATRILTRLGYRVFGAGGIDEAKRLAATEGPIHLLLTDVVMLGGSGRDVSLAVAAAHPAAKVLYMSGFTDDVIVQRGVLNPGVAFLLKPFTPDSLGRKVREVLDAR